MSSVTGLPPEIFTKFCSFLSPTDLFTLSQVCRKFREFLCAPNSFSTQKIWKNSRLQFIPKEDMPPPEGMSEEKYVVLLMTERGCQICKHSKRCKIYWEFEVRCCEECFSNKTVNRTKLTVELRFPLEFINVMPYTYFRSESHYWIEKIDFEYSQYCGLLKNNLQSWLDDKNRMLNHIMGYVKQRKYKENKRKRRSFFPLLPLLSPSFPPLFTPWLWPSPILQPTLPTLPPLTSLIDIYSEVIDNDDINHQVQFHIRRLENGLYPGSRLNNYDHEDPDGLKRNSFVKAKKNKNEKEVYSKYNKFCMKGKNFKSKFAYKYG